MSSLRRNIFSNYKKVHGDFVVDSHVGWEDKLNWFRDLYELNYSRIINQKKSRLLEVGCSQGFFLKVLSDEGFEDIHGIDLSPEDVQLAKTRFGLRNVFVADVQEFLHETKLKFDVIFAKDVLEHIEKQRLSELIAVLKNSLNPGGIALFQVPNMDWLFSPHERYMDLTHEVGFTVQSLGQLLRLHFDHVELLKISYLFPKNWKQRFLWGTLREFYLSGHRFHLKVIGEGAPELWFDCREIVGICRNPL